MGRFLLLLLVICSSCKSLETINKKANEIQEFRLPIYNRWSIGKDGIGTDEIMIEPTIINPNVNGIRYPRFYGGTIIIKF